MVPRLLAVAPNPSLDHTMVVQLRGEGPTRASEAVEAPGGEHGGPRLTFTMIEDAEAEREPVQVIGPPVVMAPDEVRSFLSHVEEGGIVIVDAVGDELAATLEERPDVVAPDTFEASRTLGRTAVVTAGSVVATPEGVWQLTTPRGIAVRNVDRCGDAYAGGLASRHAAASEVVAAASFGHGCVCAKAEQLSPAAVDPARALQLHAVSAPVRIR